MKETAVALLGFGNIGLSFARYALKHRPESGCGIVIRGAADSSGGLLVGDDVQLEQLIAHKESGRAISEFAPRLATTGAREFIQALPAAGVSVLIESLPTNTDTGQPALDLLAIALSQGTNVVTVDKGPVAHGLDRLLACAVAGSARLAFTGTTGVRVPDEVRAERVLDIRGVLNGTTNYILTEMQERSVSFEEALRGAQANGIAEPNSILDTEGWDTACKILILANSLMGSAARLSDVSRTGIGPETELLIRTGRSTGRVARLIGRSRIWQGRVRVSVAPKLIAGDSPLYTVAGTSKAAVFKTDGKGEFVSYAESSRDAIARMIEDDVRLVTTSRR